LENILPISLGDTYIFGVLQEPFLGRLSVGDGLLGCEGLLNREDVTIQGNTTAITMRRTITFSTLGNNWPAAPSFSERRTILHR
jgi:hypothetical protein